MRRPPEVVQAALYLGLLLGLSGCAGFPQRTTGGSPWANGADAEGPAPPGLFSSWHRSGVQTTGASTTPTENSETTAPSQAYAGTTSTATSPWPETQAEWVARNFPRFNRLWNGTPSARPAGPADGSGVAWTNRIPDRSKADDVAVTSDSPRSDGAVQPTDGASDRQADSRTARTASATQSLDNLPFSPTPPPVRSPRQTDQEPEAQSGSAPLNSTDSSATDGAERTSFRPGDDGGSTATKTARAATSSTAGPESPPEPPALGDSEPAPLLAAPDNSAAAGAGSARRRLRPPAPRAGRRNPRMPMQPRASIHAWPRFHRLLRRFSAPLPRRRPREAHSPPRHPRRRLRLPAPLRKLPPRRRRPRPRPPSRLRPRRQPLRPSRPLSSRASAVRGFRTILLCFTASGGARPAGTPPLRMVVPRRTRARRVGPGAPAAFPTMFSSPQNVLPTGQGAAADCGNSACATKKPCFLKVWIHDWKANHGSSSSDCGHGGTCPSAQTNLTACDSDAPAPKKPCFLKVWIHDWKASHGSGSDDCGHGGVCASPQGNAGACETAARSPKKPCFLKVWMSDWKNSHGSGCGGCQNCKCCGGGAPVTASAQGGVASPQVASPQSGRSH